MKTLLIPTDFSANAKNAAEYGYRLAKQVKTDVVLCNAVIIPAEIPQAGFVAWPMEEYDVLMNDSTDELKKLKACLEQGSKGFKPAITCFNEVGATTDVVNDVITKNKIDLVVMGTHVAGGLSSFLLGNHSRIMIDGVNKPLLLVPNLARYTPVKKIAFATDFKHPDRDLDSIYDLVPLAKSLGADILLTHVYDEKKQSPEFQKWVKQFLAELSDKSNYDQVYYRLVKNNQTESGLDWLCANGQIDMLAMVHRPHSFFDNLLKGSHTQKMAAHISIPLLVFPEKR
ncbi:MAG: universal stress protein [Sphingobacteriales bacterium]